VEAELRQQLERLARAEDRPLSYLVRRVLRAEATRTQTLTQAILNLPTGGVHRDQSGVLPDETPYLLTGVEPFDLASYREQCT